MNLICPSSKYTYIYLLRICCDGDLLFILFYFIIILFLFFIYLFFFLNIKLVFFCCCFVLNIKREKA